MQVFVGGSQRSQRDCLQIQEEDGNVESTVPKLKLTPFGCDTVATVTTAKNKDKDKDIYIF